MQKWFFSDFHKPDAATLALCVTRFDEGHLIWL